jgi:hypothetical protein
MKGVEVKLLSNRSGAYLTGDEIANAVTSYGIALANVRRVDFVDIPYVVTDDHGAVGNVRLTVGWRSELNSTTHHGEGAELHDSVLLSDLRARTSALHPSGDMALDPEEVSYLSQSEEF